MNHPQATAPAFQRMSQEQRNHLHAQALALAPVLRQQAIAQFWAALGQRMAQAAQRTVLKSREPSGIRSA